MEQRTGNFARPQSIRRQHAIKGVLHMIDKTGGVEMTTEDQNKIIANHLLQDKYEYEQKTGGRPQRYNVQQIRKLMAKLVHESKLKSTRGAEDSVTLLFHRQSQALDPTILAKCGYRRHEPLAALQQRSLQLFKDHTATPSKTANFDASRRSSPIPDVLQIAPASVSLSSPLFGDEIVLSTPSQKFHESASTQSVSSRLYSRNLKRKASADPSPQAFNQSPTVLVPRDERSDTIRHAARGLRAGTKRLFSRSQHLSPIDAVGEIQAIKDIQETQLLWMIGHLKLTQCSCPVTPQPGRELIPLYKRCWGDDWKRGGNELLMSGRRGVIGDTTALISAFLFESILTGSAPLARYTEHGAEDNDFAVMPPNSGQSHLQSQLQQVHKEAIATRLLLAIHPYFLALTQRSRMIYSDHSMEDSDPTLHSSFRNGMSEIVSKALDLRSRLDVSEMESVFFWPTRGEVYDSECMQASATPELSVSLTHVVVFTTFPGLTYVDPVVGVVYKARVVLRIEAAR